jgi:geranylgeranyl diphosphate synthase type II
MVQTPSSTFLEYAREVRLEVEAALEQFSRFDEDCPARLREAIVHSLLAPGKRLRPLLVLMAAEACGCQRSRAMPAAVAVEMVHTYSLIHDDLPSMDDDDLRRGRPTCHAAYGEAMAILAGDALQARSFEILATQISPAHVAARCCGELARAAGASALVGGQVDDLAGDNSSGDLARLQGIHRRKTGAIFLAALRMGALVAEASPSELACLEAYGEKLGLAFQITDDLLDVEGDVANLGKRVQKDQGQGKLTFPTMLGVAESRARAGKLVSAACSDLNQLGARSTPLVALAQYVMERDR